MKLIRALVLLMVVCGLGVGAYLGISLNSPYSGFGKQTFIDFPKGTSTQQMARMLAQSGVIRNTWVFMMARMIRRGATLQAGEYRFANPASPLEVFDRIARGDIFYYELVVPEGKNMFDIGAAVEQLGLFPEKEFLKAARDPALIHDLDPQARTLEGYLFPDTYRLSRHTTPEHLCRIMTGRFRTVWHGLQTDQSPHRIVTLASLVEKEGKLAEEKPLIAAVFLRRLAIGMKLDCDPTTIYAALLEGNYRGVIHRSDLANSSPYNTYQHSGLPPGPIANPGLRSLEAVLHPSDAAYLYFVARGDGSGGHRFSSSLGEQQAAVEQYRRNLAR